MTRNLILGIVFSGALALAQAPGGAGQSQPSPRPSMQSQVPGADGTTNNGPAKVDDKKFVKNAAMGGMTEVELGKLAAQKASRDDVKQFAQKMVDDHGKANDELKQVAAKSSIEVPDALDPKHQARLDKLGKLSGDEFDKAYLKDQLKDHQATVKDFTAEAQSGTDPNIKAFATTALPTLQSHLDMVKGMNKSAKGGSK